MEYIRSFNQTTAKSGERARSTVVCCQHRPITLLERERARQKHIPTLLACAFYRCIWRACVSKTFDMVLRLTFFGQVCNEAMNACCLSSKTRATGNQALEVLLSDRRELGKFSKIS